MQGTEDRPAGRDFRHLKTNQPNKKETKTEEEKKGSLETFNMNLLFTREIARNHHNPGKTE